MTRNMIELLLGLPESQASSGAGYAPSWAQEEVPKTAMQLQAAVIADTIVGRLTEICRLEENWDTDGAVPPADETVIRAAEVSRLIVSGASYVPKMVNIAATSEGGILLSMFGASGRELELWVEPDSTDIGWVASLGESDWEGEGPKTVYPVLAKWLAGESEFPG